MRLVSLQRLVTLLCLVALLLTTLTSSAAPVLCVGPRGHLAVEPAHEGTPCPFLSRLPTSAQTGAELTEVPGCKDFPLSSQLRDSLLSSLAKNLSAYWATVWTFLSPELTLGKKGAGFYSAFPLGVSDLRLTRSVILLI
jgi:hypothetical protein